MTTIIFINTVKNMKGEKKLAWFVSKQINDKVKFVIHRIAHKRVNIINCHCLEILMLSVFSIATTEKTKMKLNRFRSNKTIVLLFIK